MRRWTWMIAGILAGVLPGQGAGFAAVPGIGASTRTATAPSAAAAALYGQITSKYLAAEWETLASDLGKARDIAAMTREQQADVAYIKQAVSDGRPAWWDTLKQGRKVNFQTHIWQKTIVTTFDPTLAPGALNMQQSSNGQISLAVYWMPADMDAPAQAEHGFTKGDLAYAGIWGQLEMAQLYTSLNLQQLAKLDEAGKTRLSRFMAFRGAVTAGYFGTPRARRWSAFLSCDAYLGSHLTNEGFIPRRAFAVMLEEEIVSHWKEYPSFRMPRNQRAETIEGTLANNLMGQFERTTLTFAEDKALREAIKAFGMANGTAIFATGKVILPSKLMMPLDPAEDGDGATVRGKWLMEELAEPGVHAGAATKPGSGARTRP